MKLILLSCTATALTFLPSCTESDASAAASAERPPENGAQFKKGEGLSLTDGMTRSIGLETTEVTEEKISGRIPLTLRPLAGTSDAEGWLAAGPAVKVQAGAVVEISGSPGLKGTITSIQRPAFSALGEYEVVVTFDPPMAANTEAAASILLPETESVATIPRSALLKTAEGHFVYTTNGKFYVRTPVKTGAMNDEHVEITGGLYAGDEVVSKAVQSLWMAELQVLRGGKACTCGH